MEEYKELFGKTINDLTVLGIDEELSGKGHGVQLKCFCSCGKYVSAPARNVKNGKYKSCGHRRIKHHHYPMGVYRSWVSMKYRCNCQTAPEYPQYGGRGIKLYEPWNEFIPFRDWALANGWQEGLSIDRIDVNGNYEPSNCRWADMVTQNNNKRDNHIVLVNGEEMTLMQASRFLGISRFTLKRRLDKNKIEGVEDIGFKKVPDGIYPRNKKRMERRA